jgi:type III restriction enzyme
MSQTIIENPVINSPYSEPNRYFKFSNEGITNEIVPGRRVSSYFIPIAQPKQKTKQLTITESEWVGDRIEENTFINQIRDRVKNWRENSWPGITDVTRKLLCYWTSNNREKPLFFCQIEALETAIYLTEVAEKSGNSWILEELKVKNNEVNYELWRIAFKMATGNGKTVVMAMLLTWQFLNKIHNPWDARFSNTFLIITPGIMIRDRLRVLYPIDLDNYYSLKTEVDVSLWEGLYRTKGQPFPTPENGKIAVKVINHYRDEVLKMYGV